LGAAGTGVCPAPLGMLFVSGCGFGKGLPQLLQNRFLSGLSVPHILHLKENTRLLTLTIFLGGYDVTENNLGIFFNFQKKFLARFFIVRK
jgi:hypothetical protein